MSAEAPKVPAVPSATDFVFQRWAELTCDDPPWWARSSGVGLRLMLEELTELAHARATGAIAKEAVAALINESSRYLLDDHSLCRRRYAAASDAIRRALSDRSLENWLPGARGPSAMAAALKLVDDDKFLPTLLEVLQEEVDKAHAAAGEGQLAQAFTEIEPFVELLDAELVRDGHSRRWRQDVCADAARRAAEGQTAAEAIGAVLEAAGYHDEREFECFVLVAEYEEPAAGRLGLDALSVEDALIQIIRPWNTDDLEATLAKLTELNPDRLVHYKPQAPDLEAAARLVSHDFSRDADLWRLRGGEVSETRDCSVLIYDTRQNTTSVLELPVEPLDVLPRRLDSYAAEGDAEPTRVDDALVQLSQARMAPPATAIVNIWTAAEALFGGVVGETRSEAAEVLAGLSEYLYLLDLFRWLGERYREAGLEGAPSVESSRWGFERTIEETTRVLAALADRGDALGWWRLKVVTGWQSAGRLRKQLDAFGTRAKHVGARAYLARNAVVHNAAVRRRLVDITLPTFSGLVRECVGYIANNGAPDESLKTAAERAMKVSHLANQVADKTLKAAEAVEILLPDEPGMQLARAGADGDDGEGVEETAAAAEPGEPVPVEDLEPEIDAKGAGDAVVVAEEEPEEEEAVEAEEPESEV